jgi:tRNA modification GTPase
MYGTVHDAGTTVDTAVAGIMRAPHSYTGEDSVELYCHGGPVVLGAVLDLVCRQGCRPAEPGEFTRRAFLNGKIDLTQAEAVADLIAAPTDRTRQAAVNQLEGSLKNILQSVHDSLKDLLAEIQAGIEFPEDVRDVFADTPALAGQIDAIRVEVLRLLESADAGRILHDGYRVAIAGKPNSGKSSLLNRLACEERALVTEIPGTTRDSLEADVNIEGFPVRLIDTAGLRTAHGTVEKKGIERAVRIMNECDVIIWVADLSRRFYNNDIEGPVLNAPGATVIWVWNKSDLPSVCSAKARERIKERWTSIALSAKTGEGIDQLHETLKQLLLNKIPSAEDQALLLRARHRNLLRRCEEALSRACNALGGEYLPELVGEDIAEALAAVGELTGAISSEDLLDSIFADFCIGK